jgi:hypothetical protein
MRRYSTFLRLLDEDPVFLERVRQKILTRDLLGLPVLVAQVLDLQRQTLEALRGFMEATDRRFAAAETQIQENGRQIASLTEQVRENSRQIAALTEQVRENGRQIAALADRMERAEAQIRENSRQIAENSRQIAALTEALREFRDAAERRFAAAEAQIAENSRQIAALAEQVRENGVRMGRLEERWGLVHEDIAGELMPRFLEEKGHRVIRRVPMAFDGEVDLVMEVEVRGATRTLAVEVKGRVYGRGPFEGILRKVGDPRFRERLLREGFSGHIVPAVFGLRVYSGAAETAGELRVGLYDAGRGTVVEPDWGVP